MKHRHQYYLQNSLFFGLLVSILVACGASSTPQPTRSEGRDGIQVTPTIPAPEFSEPAMPITAENVSQIEYIGRLDAPGEPSTVFRYDISPDGTRLAGLNNDLLISWDLLTGDVIFTTSRSEAAWVYYSSDKTEIYTVHQDGSVRIYDEQGRRKNDFFGHSAFNGANDFYDDADWLAMGGDNGRLQIWDAVERLSLVTIEAHQAIIDDVVFSEDGNLVATAADDSVIKVWDWQSRTEIASFDHEGAVIRQMAFSPDGSILASGTDSYIALWSIENNELRYALQIALAGAEEVLMFSPDGRYLVSGGRMADMTVWDTETGSLVGIMPEVSGDSISADFDPNSEILLTAVLDTDVSLWNIAEITDETVPRAILDVNTNRIFQVEWTDDGFALIFVDATGPIYVWGLRNDESES